MAIDSLFASVAADTTVPDTLVQLSPLASNVKFFWHVSAANDSGASSYSLTGSFTTGDQILSVNAPERTPLAYGLSQNYPNPFNPSTIIRYTIAGDGRQGTGNSDVHLVVYDVLGREVAVLVNEKQPAGTYEARMDGTKLSSGLYFYRLTAGSFAATKTMALIK